jgi:hypothetical protein
MEELFCIEELLLKITPSSGINILFFAELSVIWFLDMKMKYNSTGSEWFVKLAWYRKSCIF